jgi:hypothetical protein
MPSRLGRSYIYGIWLVVCREVIERERVRPGMHDSRKKGRFGYFTSVHFMLFFLVDSMQCFFLFCSSLSL